MRKPNDYDSAQAYDGTIRRLPVGGYVCQIKNVDELSTRNGNEYWKVSIDISEGDFKDYYLNMWKNAKATAQDQSKVTWRGIYNVFPYTPEGFTNPYWKGFITCVEKCNTGFRMNWNADVTQFKGKMIGLIFREEEFIGTDGTTRISVKPFACRTIDDIRNNNYDIPEKKTLNRDSSAVPAGYTNANETYSNNSSVDEDDLPF